MCASPPPPDPSGRSLRREVAKRRLAEARILELERRLEACSSLDAAQPVAFPAAGSWPTPFSPSPSRAPPGPGSPPTAAATKVTATGAAVWPGLGTEAPASSAVQENVILSPNGQTVFFLDPPGSPARLSAEQKYPTRRSGPGLRSPLSSGGLDRPLLGSPLFPAPAASPVISEMSPTEARYSPPELLPSPGGSEHAPAEAGGGPGSPPPPGSPIVTCVSVSSSEEDLSFSTMTPVKPATPASPYLSRPSAKQRTPLGSHDTLDTGGLELFPAAATSSTQRRTTLGPGRASSVRPHSMYAGTGACGTAYLAHLASRTEGDSVDGRPLTPPVFRYAPPEVAAAEVALARSSSSCQPAGARGRSSSLLLPPQDLDSATGCLGDSNKGALFDPSSVAPSPPDPPCAGGGPVLLAPLPHTPPRVGRVRGGGSNAGLPPDPGTSTSPFVPLPQPTPDQSPMFVSWLSYNLKSPFRSNS
ncbi:hypothetical protein H696_02353 [Fonticula alba]|uniref:Uncharacterized protein n=1 Tax=Fonticula alba TaxID=691883 RepID=A0A058ZBV0_FONAL|nr:hypothetical protein H696_02353 [Fonticula alba]KCV71406.1 hypothetical protein H696_02353 [Fonticula alba]|eukprot:XP_009494529.1 hypothetical protein H696_02353 [Fonticula alba]